MLQWFETFLKRRAVKPKFEAKGQSFSPVLFEVSDEQFAVRVAEQYSKASSIYEQVPAEVIFDDWDREHLLDREP